MQGSRGSGGAAQATGSAGGPFYRAPRLWLVAAAAVVALGAPRAADALPPIFVTAPQTTATQNAPYEYRFRAIDLDFGDRVSYSAPQRPAWLVFDGVDRLAGTPLADDVGTHAVTIVASDGSSTASQTFQIIVANVDDPPRLVTQIAPDPQAVSERATYDFSVAPFFRDPDGDALVFSATNLPPDLAINPVSGRITGQPRALRRGDASRYEITVTASNATGAASDSFILIINNENDPPRIPEPVPRLTTPEDVPLDITPTLLGADDVDPDDTLSVILQPPGADARYRITGTRVEPDANFHGTLTVRAQVRDAAGALSNTASVLVEVVARNDAPRANTIPAQTADEGRPFTFHSAPYFSDADNDPLTYQARGLPPGLSVDSATGVIAGTPPIGTEAREYDVEIIATDGTATAVATFKTAVLQAKRADLVATAKVAPTPSTVGNQTTWTVAVKNDSAVDVGNVDLAAVFTGDVPLTFASPDRAECSIRPAAAETKLDCRFGALAANTELAVKVSSTASRAGAAHAEVTASIADPLPIDGNRANDKARATLDIAARLSSGPAQRLTVQDARAAAGADLDGDGFNDLAVATAGGPVVFPSIVDPANPHKRRLADVARPLGADSANGQGLAVGDVDGDGDSDVVTANAGGHPNKVLRNDGAGAFTASTIADTTAASRAVALGDVDGDGDIDLAFANEGGASVHLNDGTGRYALAQRLGTGDGRDALLANLFGDALPELVLARSDGDVAVFRNTAGRMTQELELPSGPAATMAAADFDRDGDVDLIVGRAPGGAAPAAAVFLNTSGAAAAFFASSVLLGEAQDLVAVDLDGDGDSDLAAFGATGGHRVYLNDGAARFALHAEQFVHAGATGAAAAKLSVDDRIDLAVAGSTAIGLFFNDGATNFGAGDTAAPIVTLRGEPKVTVTVGQTYQDSGATAADGVDGDLTAKIVVKNPVDTAVVGTYTVAYDVSDTSGNRAPTATRTVEVRPLETTGGGGGGAVGFELALLCATLAYLRGRRAR